MTTRLKFRLLALLVICLFVGLAVQRTIDLRTTERVFAELLETQSEATLAIDGIERLRRTLSVVGAPSAAARTTQRLDELRTALALSLDQQEDMLAATTALLSEEEISELLSGAVQVRKAALDVLDARERTLLAELGLVAAADSGTVAATLVDEFQAAREAERATALAFGRLASALPERIAAIRELEAGLAADLRADAAALSKRMMFRDVFGVTLVALLIFGAMAFLIERHVIERLYDFNRNVLEATEESVAQQADPGDTAAALAAVRNTAEQLRRSNEDLAQFAYVAAHDLRSPLLAIRDIVDWIGEDHGPSLTPEVRDSLALLRSRANRLLALLADLLAYARAEAKATACAQIDVENIVREVEQMLDPGGTFEVRFEGARKISSAIMPIKTIVLNLVGNAMKHHDRHTGRIKVTSEISGGAFELRVADDGPGIPVRFQKRIFGVFQTLQSRDQVEGSGMGLAMVRRLAESLGGTIAVQSDPDVARGTTFILRIPLSAQTPTVVERPRGERELAE